MYIQAKSRSAQVGVIIALSTILLAGLTSTEARYLPTRADETDMEVLKDLIKGLIIQSNLDQLDAKIMNRQQAEQTNRYYHQSGPQQHIQVERRSIELPVGSDGDMYFSENSPVAGGKPIKSDR